MPPIGKKSTAAVSIFNTNFELKVRKPPKGAEKHSNQERKKILSQEAWEAVFDFLMNKHMIFDIIPDDYYHEEI